MLNVSSEFLQKLYNDERDYKERIEITLKDGTELELTNPDIWQGSFAFEDAVGSDGTFTAVGSAIVNSFKFSINNIYENFSEYDFTDAEITAHVGLQVGNTIEELDKGVFTVQDAVYNGSIISITAYDNMSKFDRPYSESNLVYPTTALAIVQDACLVCGVTLAANSAAFPNYNFPISEKPSGESTTFREVISWVATIACCFARCNTEGKLEFKWFDKQALDDNEFLDGGIFDGGTGNYIKPSMRVGDKFQDNGLTVEYTHDGWWHVYGTREDNSAIRFDLYEDVLDETSGSYTFRLETKGFTTSQEPKIGYLCYPQEGQLVSWNSSVSPYTTNVYSLPILGLAFWQRTGSALPAYDGFVRFSVTETTQKSYQTGDTADGGIFNPWETGYEYDSNLHDHGRIHILSSLYSSNIAVDDVVITQVAADIKVKSESSSNDLRHVTYGEDGYAICISNNDFITESNWETILGYIGDEIIGLRFRKVNLSHASNPSIEAGDIAYVYDRKGNRYQILITRTNFTVGSSQTTVCGADAPARNSAARFSEATKSYVELRKQIKVVDNPYAKALADLAEAMQQPGGMYTTEVVQPDQSVITYQHNMPLLAESDKQIAITDIGMTFTSNGTDPNPTWYGHTVDGQVVASILNAAGVNAEWIRTGELIVEDSHGNETFYANYATGVVRINATSFSLTSGDTIESIAEDAASTAVSTSNTYTDNKFNTLDQSLTQQNVFDRLTNNGTAQGIIMQNGQLYINMSYLQTGTIKLGGTNNISGTLEVYDGSNPPVRIGKWDKDGAIITGDIKNSKNYTYNGETRKANVDIDTGRIIVGDTNSSGTKYTYAMISEFLPNNSGIPEAVNSKCTSASLITSTNDKLSWSEIRGLEIVPYHAFSVGAFIRNGSAYRYDRCFNILGGDVTDTGNIRINIGSSLGKPEILFRGGGIDCATTVYISENKMCPGTIYRPITNQYIKFTWVDTSRYWVDVAALGINVNNRLVQVESSSSKRYKHNIELIKDELLDPHRLYNLKVKQFRYNVDVPLQYQDMYGMTLPGFIAEDVAEIYPSAVIHRLECPDDIESWDERRIVPPMLALIQEQHQQIDELVARIEQLELLIKGV